MKNKIQRLLRPLGIALAVLAVVFALGFVERTADRDPVVDIEVEVSGADGIHFLDAATVRQELVDLGTAVRGAPIGEVDLPGIERRLRNMPAVAEAEVYHTLDGVLHVKVRQREPIVRVFNKDGSSFYIDREGWTMPTSTVFTARVPVVVGELEEPGASDGVRHVHTDTGYTGAHGHHIHRLLHFIHQDPFWHALIDQVEVNAKGEYELLPRVGAHRVLIGHPESWGEPGSDALAQRFAKLDIFYRKGMAPADRRRFARIDLRFADQIVCTNRTTP